jgi:hypothetical protein
MSQKPALYYGDLLAAAVADGQEFPGATPSYDELYEQYGEQVAREQGVG